MSEYFSLNSNRKDIKRLREYLKALAEKPESGVFIVNFENEEIEKLREQISKELLIQLAELQNNNSANANDVIIYLNNETNKRL